MIKATLQYTGSADSKKVLRVLAQRGIKILYTRQGYPYLMDYQITIYIEDERKLCELIDELNQICYFSVMLAKAKYVKKCISCEQRNDCSKLRQLFSFLCKKEE